MDLHAQALMVQYSTVSVFSRAGLAKSVYMSVPEIPDLPMFCYRKQDKVGAVVEMNRSGSGKTHA